LRWRLNPIADLHWRGWGDQAVAFERVSGEMVVCDALEASVMACFESGMQGVDEIHAQLAGDLGVSPSADLAAQLQAMIDDFAIRGWIEPAA
jgi:hypothetical protein